MSIVETLRGTGARAKWTYQAMPGALTTVAQDVCERIDRYDFQGARAELVKCGDAGQGNERFGGLLLALSALLERVSDLQLENACLASAARVAECGARRDEHVFSHSAHLSLLTAAVLRQRSQIDELLLLTETLSDRLA